VSLTKLQSRSTNKKHFEPSQSSLWMMPLQPTVQEKKNASPQCQPPSYGSPVTDFFRQTELSASTSPLFAHKRAVYPASIGVVLPPKQSPIQKFEAAHQVSLGDMGWHCAMTRELNLTMHQPSRISCTSADVLARSLPAFVRLQVLHLGSNAIADSGASAIVHACAGHVTVRQLYLHGNRLTSHSAADIASALQSCSCRLEVLTLGGNMLGNAGVQRIALALRGQTSLATLDVVCAPGSIARANLTHLIAVKQPSDGFGCGSFICCPASQRLLAGFRPERQRCNRQRCEGTADCPWIQHSTHFCRFESNKVQRSSIGAAG
jgi:hypothetical protein